MQYRKFLADRVFDGLQFIDGDQVVITNAEGEIQDIVGKDEAGSDTVLLNGILTPGLINAHCHLELSHMKGAIPPHTGLIDFLIGVVTKRGVIDEAIIREKIAEAEEELYRNGVVAVVDIVNTLHALATKQISRLRWYNLIEVLNFFDQTLPERWKHNQDILAQHLKYQSLSVLTPHAPYTVSTGTFKEMNKATAGKIISIHNQETAAEDELFKKGTGKFLQLFETAGIGPSPFSISGKSSLQTWLPQFTQEQKIILVHNTFIQEEDIVFAKNHAEKNGLTIAYCLCPNANLYIENTLPPLNLLMHHQCTILLGTDSYSSNWQLSIANEIETLQKHFPHCSLSELLQWATSSSAAFFGWKDLGMLKKGAKPGLVLLETNPAEHEKITGKSTRII